MTADTYSNTLGYLIMGVGNDNNTWGGNCSTAVFQILEDAIANSLTNTVTGGTLDLSGSPPPAAASQARYSTLFFNGTLTSNQTVIVPNLQKWWMVSNATSGAFTLSIKTPSGTAVSIPQWSSRGLQQVYCNGSDIILVAPFNWNQIRMPDGSAALPPYSNINEPNSGWYRAATQDWRLSINGADVLQATGTGAGSPSILNILSPLSLQLAGAQVLPPGMEAPYAGINAPTGWLFEYGQAISRTTYAALFAALTFTCTGNTHSNTTLDNLSVNPGLQGLVGAFVEGTGIPTGTTVVSLSSGTSLVLSQAATSTSSNIAIRLLPHGQGDASTTFNVPDRRGRTIFGRDDMGSTPANRLTKSTSQGVLGSQLAGTGGEQAHTPIIAEMPSHGHAIADHAHGIPHAKTSNTVHDHSDFSASADGPNPGSGGDTPSNTSTVSLAAAVNGGGLAFNVVPPAGVANYIIKT